MGTRLEAVVFDVDGTLVDSERFGHRVAFNEAFAGAGLPYAWDEETYGRWLHFHGGVRRIDAFLEEVGLPEAERRELAPLLHTDKTRRLRQMIDAGRIPPRPGMVELLDHLGGAGVRLGVATVGSSGWVIHLLARLFPEAAFEVVVTGADVSEKKPHPGCYLQALAGLGVSAGSAVAVEDSATGLASARAAGLACIVVVNDYTVGEDMSGAQLVLDGVHAEAGVMHDPLRLQPSMPLDRQTLERVLAADQRSQSQEYRSANDGFSRQKLDATTPRVGGLPFAGQGLRPWPPALPSSPAPPGSSVATSPRPWWTEDGRSGHVDGGPDPMTCPPPPSTAPWTWPATTTWATCMTG